MPLPVAFWLGATPAGDPLPPAVAGFWDRKLPGATATLRMPLDALQATAPAVAGLSATSTSATALLEVAYGAETFSTMASPDSSEPGCPGQASVASLTS